MARFSIFLHSFLLLPWCSCGFYAQLAVLPLPVNVLSLVTFLATKRDLLRRDATPQPVTVIHVPIRRPLPSLTTSRRDGTQISALARDGRLQRQVSTILLKTGDLGEEEMIYPSKMRRGAETDGWTRPPPRIGVGPGRRSTWCSLSASLRASLRASLSDWHPEICGSMGTAALASSHW